MQLLEGPVGPVRALAFSADGLTLAAVSGRSHVIWLWDLETGKPRTQLRGHERRVVSLAFSPTKAERLASADSRGRVLLWELDQSERTLRAYLGKRRSQLELQADEPLGSATGRIVTLAMEALTRTRAAWWSGLGEWDAHTITHALLPPHIGPRPPRYPRPGDLWRDTSGLPHVVREYGPARDWGVVIDHVRPGMPRRALQSVLSTLLSDVEVRVRWPRLTSLNADVQLMLTNRMGPAGQNGRPAYLACATLAALLAVELKHVVEVLADYRRTLS